ncbi:helix-turn-helix transcriptional regulator [Patulibacter sp. NPDC049589]|uniref:response regulator transcription factor n=1 Tax=Patulibacter sp. NPDC049589 TaxID=3154731 RepID=UPI00341A865E
MADLVALHGAGHVVEARREGEVLTLLADGLRYRGIADVLGISVATARAHLRNVSRKLGVANRAQAVLKAAEDARPVTPERRDCACRPRSRSLPSSHDRPPAGGAGATTAGPQGQVRPGDVQTFVERAHPAGSPGYRPAHVAASVVPHEGEVMTYGTALFLIAVGAILRFAVHASTKGFSIHTAGTILMVIGVVGLLLSLLWGLVYDRRRDTVVVDDRPRARY